MMNILDLVSKEKVGNSLMKKIILFLLLTSSSVYSTEIKLQCKVEVTETSKTSENKYSKNLMINIKEEGSGKLITSQGEPSITILTNKNIPQDLSDENNWNLINTTKTKDVQWSREININRNNGFITYNSIMNFEGSIQVTSIEGYCSKIDTTKKKF